MLFYEYITANIFSFSVQYAQHQRYIYICAHVSSYQYLKVTKISTIVYIPSVIAFVYFHISQSYHVLFTSYAKMFYKLSLQNLLLFCYHHTIQWYCQTSSPHELFFCLFSKYFSSIIPFNLCFSVPINDISSLAFPQIFLKK